MTPKVSDANHWMVCNGSALAQAQFPPLPGEVSQSRLDGRACHEAAQTLLNAARAGEPEPQLLDTLSKDGVVITRELLDAAEEYVSVVMGVVQEHNINPFMLHIETRVALDHIAPGWYGIPDANVWAPDAHELHIFDAKFGHRLVDVFEHWPMILYASGAIRQLGATAKGTSVKRIVLHIVQPRSFHSGGTHRTWSFPVDKLEEYENAVRGTLRMIEGGSAPCSTGSHCTTCSARAHCDTLMRDVYSGLEFVDDLNTHDLHGHALGLELKLLNRYESLFKARLSGLEEQAIHEIKSGKTVTFFGTKQGYGRERWKKETPHGEIIMMGDLMGVDLRKPVELDTPAQARKKGVDESVIAAYSETPMTVIKLVEVDGTEARQVFTRNEG